MQINKKTILYSCFFLVLILFAECLIIFKPFIKMMELYTLFIRVNPESLKPVLDFGAENFVLASAVPMLPNVEFANYPLIYDLFLTFLASGLIAFLMFFVPNIFIGFCLGLSTIFSFCIFSLYMSHVYNVWIPIVWPCCIQVFTLLTLLAAKASSKQSKQVSMVKIFGYDINEYPNTVPYIKNIISEPKKTEITLAFFRMKVPQLYMEESNTENLVFQLNDVFKIIIDTALKHSAIIDKTSSSSIIVYWMGKDNALNAVKTAMEINKILAEKERIIKVSAGISTGDSIFALLGSEYFANYTVIGTNTEIATRLENACVFHNTSLLISAKTQEKIKDKLVATHRGLLSVHGVREQINFYEPESFIE